MNDLFSEFSDPGHEKWLGLVEKELKHPLDPIEIGQGIFSNPYVEQKFSKKNVIQKKAEGWIAFEKIEINNTEESHKAVLEALNGGASGLHLVFNNSEVSLFKIFQDVDLSILALAIEANQGLQQTLESLDEFCKLHYNRPIEIFSLSNITENQKFKSIQIIPVFEESPEKSLIENLASALSNAETYGIEKGEKFWIKLNSSENFYINVAKIRALKILWKHILDANDINSPEMMIWIEIKNTGTDPNSNVIAATQQAAAAISGSANAIEIDHLNYPSPEYSVSFSARIARNIQNLLWFESHLTKVDDPAAGSYFIEDLTEKLKKEIWTLFLKNR